MEEEQVGKRSKKWLWISSGVLAGLVSGCFFLILVGKPTHSYGFLKGAQLVSYGHQINREPGRPPVHTVSAQYHIESADANLLGRIDKELVAAGWKSVQMNGVIADWTSKEGKIQLQPGPDEYLNEVWVWSDGTATPISYLQVWLSRKFERDENPLWR